MQDIAYLREAYKEAVKSRDPSSQNGAVLVDPNTGVVLCRGFNDIHHPLHDKPERRKRPLKLEWTEHAERAVIYAAARQGIRTSGLWMYCPWFACADCGRAIVMAGITRFVGHYIPKHDERPEWAASISVAEQMFNEAGIEIVRISEQLGVRIRFAGKEINI